ncbi:hypothetical protein PIB30_101118, partial [Stylosanthes scabra]|nr:hypothetical protein [Stylosanthes scabra]
LSLHLPCMSVDFHAYAWVLVTWSKLGCLPRICLLQRIYVGLEEAWRMSLSSTHMLAVLRICVALEWASM